MTDSGYRVGQLWRYPVKSIGGVPVDSVAVARRGVHADRLWAVRDLEQDMTASARRIPVLLSCTASYARDPGPDAGPGSAPEVIITVPGVGEISSDDPDVHATLSQFVGRDVRLTPLAPADDTDQQRLTLRQSRAMGSLATLRREFGFVRGEPLPDLSRLRLRDVAVLGRYSTPPGSFTDLSPVHVLTTASLETLAAATPESTVDVRRFRPNVLLTGGVPGTLPEDGWAGGELRSDSLTLSVTMPTVRCVVPSRAQPGLEVDRGITRALTERAGRYLGVYADVRRAGTVAVGDVVTFHPADAPAGPVPRALGVARRESLRAVRAAVGRLV